MGGMRLDSRTSALGKGDSGRQGLLPGDSGASELIRRVTATEKSLRMPLGAPPLSPEQIQTLRAWIENPAGLKPGALMPAMQLSRRDVTRPEKITLTDWLQEFRAEFCQTTVTPETAIDIAAEGSDIEIRVDPTHLHQVLWNLCENALKYARGDAARVVELRVQDCTVRAPVWIVPVSR